MDGGDVAFGRELGWLGLGGERVPEPSTEKRAELQETAEVPTEETGSSPSLTRWYWYLEQSSEIFLDLDFTGPRFVMLTIRLEECVRSGKPGIREIHMYPSTSDNHAHVVLRLNHWMSRPEKEAWSLRLGSDRYRSAANLMRYSHTGGRADDSILISPAVFFDLRVPDFMCDCTSKHTPDVMESCPVGLFLARNPKPFGEIAKTGHAWGNWAHYGRIYP